ncbi:sugar ABC transporter substrate-binding protein [Lachnoclostridium sp.]|uniref:ABC transporter substrate-binding protein n=1 Tax=Lachnoclostridium sp. TaxID=2028282 RepID=UPI002899A5CE|nr:sugar ABC transporter substrate-binding protein [Lachnoclostridium sp.]
MKLKKVLALTLAACMVCTSMVACSKNDNKTQGNDTNTSQEGNKEEKPGATTGGKKVLSVTTWDNDTSPQFQAIIDAYEAKNTDVEIKVIDTASDEYNNSLGISLSAAQSDPDIIWVKDMGSMLQMVDKNQLLQIDDFIKADNLDLSVYSGGAEQLQYNGASYALPYRSDWYVLYYNKDLFDAAGVEYPSNDMTWQEYYELAAKLTSGEGSAKVYGGHNHTWQALVTNWAVQDGQHTVVEKDYSFLKKWYEEALSLQENGYIQDYATLKTANIHYSSVFKNQQCAMMPMGTWFISIMMQSQTSGETNFNWGIARIPHPENTESGYTVGALTPIAISKNTDEPELSWDFVKFAASKEAAEILAQQGVFTGIQTETSLKTISSAEFFPEGASNVEALTYTNYFFDRPLDPKIEEIRQVLNEVHEMIMIKSYSIDDGLAELTKRVSDIKGWN